jgi:NADPH:quinone reductase
MKPTIKPTMKAMLLNEYGETSTFEKNEIPQPIASAGQVVIRIAATSVNTVDTKIRLLGSDLPLSPELPAVLGMDFAGTITAVGEGVSKFKVGDEVFGCAGGLADLQGALAEFMLADEKLIAHKPKTLSMKEASALPLVGITAYEGLMRAGIQQNPENKKVLVHGGAGGVGHVALQLANYFGADVYATASKDKQMALIEKLGATAINYRDETVADYVEQHTAGAGFDLVFDSVGGENMQNSFEAATLNGHIASTVSMVEMDLTTMHFKGLSLHVVFMLIPMLHNHKREQHSEILTTLANIADQGKLQPIVDEQSFNLDEVGQAYAHLSSGQVMGKVVVEV